eukprot:245396_1
MMKLSAILIPFLWAIQFNTCVSFSHTPPVRVTGSGPPAYVVIEAQLKQSEMERFASYASQVPSLVRKFGGEYIVLGGKHEPLEGEWEDTRLVMHKWPNAEMAKQFWDSVEYQELKKIREGTGDFRIMLVEGLDAASIEEQ